MDFLVKLDSTLGGLPDYGKRQIQNAIRKLNPSVEEIKPFITEPDGLEYGRNVIYKTDGVEVIIVHLPPLAKTLVHDHGFSNGSVYVLEGRLLNMIYHRNGKQTLYQKNEEFTVGEGFSVEGDTVHLMYNPDLTRCITFHVYAPPLGMKKNDNSNAKKTTLAN
ncbi:cysteine dioxygenase [Peribacillus sp. SCS-155]|uniref:cysteine dioxygenase n=1 Tax=Peribacillus sedimenti TaxID=3115297 RepID=UPI0039066AFD